MEIDDIFASKGRPKLPAPSAPIPSSSSLPAKKKKKDKKRKRDPGSTSDVDRAVSAPKTKRPVPETVVDPSVFIASTTVDSRTKRPREAPPPAKKRKPSKKDEQKFKDSRGTGPRRKTEEGFSIYKEDELGILDEGGDTPLCPFDCECCF